MRRKINNLFLFSILFGILLVSLMTINLVDDNYIKSVEERLISNAKLGIEMIDKQNISDYDIFAKRIGEITSARVTIIDYEGVVIGDSEASIIGLENHKFRPEIQRAYEGNIGLSQRYSDTIKEDMYYVALPVESESLVFRLALPLDQINKTNRILLRQILIASFIAITFSLILGFRFIKSLVDPINELTVAAQSIASGNYGEKVFLDSDDEIGKLSQSFNQMSEELNKRIHELNERNDETKAILSSMINGVIAINNNYEIMFINESVLKIFNLDVDLEAVKGRKIIEFFRHAALNERLKSLIQDNELDAFEMKINRLPQEKILKFYSNRITSDAIPLQPIGHLIMIQDMTEIRKLENMRKDFVANVSHEIKTPLTSIRGFIETLKEIDADQEDIRHRFLNIIEIESNRLNSLIDDLLIISDIEKSDYKDVNEVIDIEKTINEIDLLLSHLGEKKGVNFKIEMPDELPNIIGHSRWFKQMLINLIDNGIKYTPEGGTVKLSVNCTAESCIFAISDTGIGIEEQHLERLFERFYRVDKARSREIGGTGLGLAIVKHAVSTFNGHVDVRSEVNKGTTFKVTIPRVD